MDEHARLPEVGLAGLGELLPDEQREGGSGAQGVRNPRLLEQLDECAELLRVPRLVERLERVVAALLALLAAEQLAAEPIGDVVERSDERQVAVGGRR